MPRRIGWKRRRRAAAWTVTFVVVVVLALGTFAITAANTVPATKAGDGSGAVSGFVVSAIKYNLNATSPGNIDSVTFTLDSTPAAGSTMKIQLAAAGSWYSCTNAGANLTCATTSPQATVAGASTLRIVVAQ
jgi:hypothetical protein